MNRERCSNLGQCPELQHNHNSEVSGKNENAHEIGTSTSQAPEILSNVNVITSQQTNFNVPFSLYM
jgi:hypothetical protein